MTSKASGVALVSSLFILSVTAYKFHTKKIEEIRKHFGDLRDAERKGRIKAEIKLRTQVKEEEEKRVAASLAFYSNEKSSNDSDEKPMLLKCIGSVRSPFTKRMGTPRQGALAPHSRGYIQLNHSVAPMETLSGLDMYSHAWILFQFHANTDLQSISVKTKIRPPRGGGIKVGSMATRSPHRPNNIGLSLVKIDGIDTKKKRLYISALDLCNGTPVYDIKPVVPWDIPGHFNGEKLLVPEWVSADDEMSSVVFSKQAESDLSYLSKRNKFAPFYNESSSKDAADAIKEVLAQDPRAVKKRGKVDETSQSYKVTFGSCEISFLVPENGVVEVLTIEELKLNNSTFVDGIPLANKGTTS